MKFVILFVIFFVGLSFGVYLVPKNDIKEGFGAVDENVSGYTKERSADLDNNDTNSDDKTLNWEDIDARGWLQYIDNLKRIGCPARTVADIIDYRIREQDENLDNHDLSYIYDYIGYAPKSDLRKEIVNKNFSRADPYIVLNKFMDSRIQGIGNVGRRRLSRRLRYFKPSEREYEEIYSYEKNIDSVNFGNINNKDPNPVLEFNKLTERLKNKLGKERYLEYAKTKRPEYDILANALSGHSNVVGAIDGALIVVDKMRNEDWEAAVRNNRHKELYENYKNMLEKTVGGDYVDSIMYDLPRFLPRLSIGIADVDY